MNQRLSEGRWGLLSYGGSNDAPIAPQLSMASHQGPEHTDLSPDHQMTWTTAAPLPTVRYGVAAMRVFFDGRPRIEVVGGSAPGNNLQYIP